MALLKFEISRRGPYAQGRTFGASTGAFEQIDGIAHFAVDPSHTANQRIIDLQLAPRDDKGLVHFEADLSIVTPVDGADANGRAIVELPNRGRRRVVPVLNRAPFDAPVSREAHPGDGFLFAHGFTVVSIGWQWDVSRSESMMGLSAPLAMSDAQPVHGQTMVEIRPSTRVQTWLLADRTHLPLPASAGEQRDAVLYVRDFEDGEDEVIDRDRWQFSGANGEVDSGRDHLHLAGGFDPGRIYQFVYATDRAPVAGTGLLALRDVAQFLRAEREDNPCAARPNSLIAWGVSQTGRMLRDFLYLGLNQCEDGTPAYDGIAAHVAGARRGSFNHRFAQPSNQTTPHWGHSFPYADVPTTDHCSGRSAGLLDSLEEADATPKIIYTNSAAEYWRGDATLAHTDTASQQDLSEHPRSRSYLFSSVQHGPGYIGQSRTNAGVKTTARYPLNILDYRPLLRAALLNLDRWIVDGVEPPPSRHPRLADGTAVTRDVILDWYAKLPGFEVPQPDHLPFVREVDMGANEQSGVARYPAREGAFYPALVSAIDDDGNERAGIRLPDVAVPVGSHTGWNPRDPKTGAPDQIVPMNGLTWLFAADEDVRAHTDDPRPSIAQRYVDAADYEARVRAVTLELVGERYLLDEDVEVVVDAAMQRYAVAAAGGNA
jgi:hypothetical protein